MPCKLSVNLNAVAYLRNRRHVQWPDLLHLGRIALDAGAAGLTVHPRPDERHVRRADVPLLADLVREYPGREFNIEGYPDEDFLRLVETYCPHQVTLVPDLFVSDAVFDGLRDQLLQIGPINPGAMYIQSNDPDAALVAIERLYKSTVGGNFSYQSMADFNQNSNLQTLLTNLFFYGFLTLITLAFSPL